MSQAGFFIPGSITPGIYAETLTGNSGGPVPPDGVGNINVVGDGTTIDVVGNPGTNTLTISAISAGASVLTLTGNSGGAVSPDGLGNIDIVNANTTVDIVGNPGTNTLTQDFNVTNLVLGTDPTIAGIENVGVGVNVFSALNTGAGNTAVGGKSASVITSMIGGTSIGWDTFLNLTSGNNNTTVGALSTRDLVTGDDNTALGQESLLGFTSGDFNTAVGTRSGSLLGTGNNNAYFASIGGAAENNTLRLGQFSTVASNAAHTSAYVAGVSGVTVGGPFVTIATSNGQLGRTTLSSDSSGRVTNTSQPLFSVRMATLVANVTGDGTAYTIIFDTEDIDQGGVFNIATGVFTAPVTGTYLLGVNCLLADLTSGHTSGVLRIVTTPRTYTGGTANPFACSAGGTYNMAATAMVSLTAGQTALFDVIVNNSTLTVDVAGATQTWAYGYLVA